MGRMYDQEFANSFAGISLPDVSYTGSSIPETEADAGRIGGPVQELTGASNLAMLDMDSLTSLTVLGKLQEILSIDLPSDFFGEDVILDAIEATLDIQRELGGIPPRLDEKPSWFERKAAIK
ncbi:MAG: hypothetical protein M1830_002411 [Pleopsidium flavum]|nr:MAG: hypothetical protein M1830_002411 [Pleopsidium flavum]